MPVAPPSGGAKCYEKKDGTASGAFKSEFITKLGPERLYRLASPEMRFYLDGRSDPQHLRFHDFVWAAERRVPELGISPDAWAAAKEVMGDDSAMLSVFVLDARRAEPGNTIFKPGGYLRGMTEKFRQGDLHLIRSLIGLSERKREEDAS